MSQQDNPARTLQEDFILREHEALQDKMGRSAADLWRIETLVPLGVAALYAWLAKEGGQIGAIREWLLWVPVGLVLFGACRQELRYRYIDVVEDYLMRLETSVYGEREDLRGWENHWKSMGSYGNRYARRVVWTAVFVASVLIALNGRTLYAPQTPPPQGGKAAGCVAAEKTVVVQPVPGNAPPATRPMN